MNSSNRHKRRQVVVGAALFLLLLASRGVLGILHSEAMEDTRSSSPVVADENKAATTQNPVMAGWDEANPRSKSDDQDAKPIEPNFVIYEQVVASTKQQPMTTSNPEIVSSLADNDQVSATSSSTVLSDQYAPTADHHIDPLITTTTFTTSTTKNGVYYQEETTDGLVTPAPATTLATPTPAVMVTTPTPTESIVVVVNKAEMESFEEWKEMKLKEAAAVAINNHPSSSGSGGDSSSTSSDQTKSDTNGDTNSSNNQLNSGASSSSSNGNSMSTDSGQNGKEATTGSSGGQNGKETLSAGRRKNYASMDCGAKIIATNPDASNAAHVLTESKDDYMLNSCSSKIWFVVELCEPIKISEIQIANLELFSNVPRQFRVYASERYLASPNANSWPNKYFLGVYEAANSRSIQSFYIKDAVLNAAAMAASAATTTTTTSGQNGTDSVDTASSRNNVSSMVEPTSVIMYAKYIKFEMLSHYGQEHFCPLSLVRIFGTSIVDEDDEAHDDATAAAAAAAAANNRPLVDEAVVNEEVAAVKVIEPVSSSPNGQGGKEKKSPKMFATFLNNIVSLFLRENFNIKNIFSSFSSPTSQDLNQDKQREETSTSTPSTTLSSTSTSTDHTRNPIQFDLQNQDQHDGNIMKRNNILQIDLHKLLCFSSNHKLVLDCCKCLLDHQSSRKRTSSRMTSSDIHYQGTPNTWLSKYCGYYFLMITTAQARSNSSLLVKFIKNVRSNQLSNETTTNFTHIMINDVNYFINNKWLDDQAAAAHNLLNSPPTVDTTNNLRGDSTVLHQNESVPEVKSSPNNATESESVFKETPPTVTPSQIDEKQQTTETMSTTTTTTTVAAASTTLPESNIEVDSTSSTQSVTTTTTTTAATISITPTVSTTQPIVIANGKDAVFMRLNNRIKILELNMSLSSQYLEKLSQHYRKQIDEMQRAFNLTTSALMETIRVADERDVKQNDKILTMEKRVERMQQNIDSLNLLLNDLKFQTDIIIWTIIVMFHTILAIELFRCVKNQVSKRRRRGMTTETQTDLSVNGLMQYEIEQMVNSRVQTLMDREYKEKLASLEHELSRLKGQMTTNEHVETIRSESDSTIMDHRQQQKVAAAAATMSTLAVAVAAVSIAAANAAASANVTTAQTTNEE